MSKLNFFSWFARLFRHDSSGKEEEVHNEPASPLDLEDTWKVDARQEQNRLKETDLENKIARIEKSREEKTPENLANPQIKEGTHQDRPLTEILPASEQEVENKKEVPVKKKKRKSRRYSEPDVDTKGFKIITDKHDLHALFGGETDNRNDDEEDFAKMFEESQTDSFQIHLMENKKRSEKSNDTGSLTASQKIKLYPDPEIVLDLHGYTAAEAEEATEAFIRKAQKKNVRTVRLITGKGLHSEGKAVLPDVVERKILELKRKKQLLGYRWEKKDKRKSGAVIAFLNPPD